MFVNGFRPVLTDVQGYAAGLVRKLRCARHNQVHWMISREYPDIPPEKVMCQLRYLNKVINDGGHYLWPGCEVNPVRITAVDIMLRLCGATIPLFEASSPPCELLFLLLKSGRTQAFRIYTPLDGQEAECRAIAENRREPIGHAVVIYVRNKRQIPLLEISRPHIFAVSDCEGGFSFQEAMM